MDFYTTKYQGGPMQSLAPMLMTMLSGSHRLEEQDSQDITQPRHTRALAPLSLTRTPKRLLLHTGRQDTWRL